MSLQLYASAALSGLPPLNGGSMLAVIASTEPGSRVVLRLRHQVVMDRLAHHPPPPVEHPSRPQSPPSTSTIGGIFQN